MFHVVRRQKDLCRGTSHFELLSSRFWALAFTKREGDPLLKREREGYLAEDKSLMVKEENNYVVLLCFKVIVMAVFVVIYSSSLSSSRPFFFFTFIKNVSWG